LDIKTKAEHMERRSCLGRNKGRPNPMCIGHADYRNPTPCVFTYPNLINMADKIDHFKATQKVTDPTFLKCPNYDDPKKPCPYAVLQPPKTTYKSVIECGENMLRHVKQCDIRS
jgi:hypothetical protein